MRQTMCIDELLLAIAASASPENRAALEEMVRLLQVHGAVTLLRDCEIPIYRGAEVDASSIVVCL